MRILHRHTDKYVYIYIYISKPTYFQCYPNIINGICCILFRFNMLKHYLSQELFLLSLSLPFDM